MFYKPGILYFETSVYADLYGTSMIHKGSDSILPTSVNPSLQRDNPFVPAFDTAMLRVHEHGYQLHYYRLGLEHVRKETRLRWRKVREQQWRFHEGVDGGGPPPKPANVGQNLLGNFG